MINISEPRDDLQRANNQKVIDFGWPEHLAPPLERLCNICKSLDSWLNSDLGHVVVLHCKGGRGRLAVIIAAFLNYSNICSRLVLAKNISNYTNVVALNISQMSLLTYYRHLIT